MTSVRSRGDGRRGAAPAVRRRHVVGALGRAEAWRLLRHPLTLAGAGLSAIIMVLWFQGDLVVLHRASIQLPVLLLPLYALLLVAAHANTSRTRRDDTAEVVDPAPTEAADRVLAHLLATLAGGALAGVLVGVALLVLWATGAIWGPIPAELAVGPVVATVAGAIGVLAGTWTPARPAVLLWLAPLAFLQLTTSESLDARTRIRAPVFETSAMQLSEFGYRPTAAHLVYLAGIGLAVAGLAVMRHRRDTLVVGATTAGLVAGIAGGVLQARAPDDAWFARMASLVEEPAAHSVCSPQSGIDVCTLPAYAAWAPRVGSIVAEVADRLPPERRTRVERVQQGVAPQLRWFATRPWDRDRSLRTGGAGGSEGEMAQPLPEAIVFPVSWGQEGAALAELRLGLRAAATALGIPALEIVRERVSSDDAAAARATGSQTQTGDVRVVGQPCHTARQARTVIALWLAGQASPAAGDALRAAASAVRAREVTVGTTDGAVTIRLFDPTSDYVPFQVASGEIPPVANEAVVLVAQMVEKPSAAVMSELMAELDRWSDPATPVTELVAALDLTPVPTPGEQIAAAGAATELSMGEPARDECTAVLP